MTPSTQTVARLLAIAPEHTLSRTAAPARRWVDVVRTAPLLPVLPRIQTLLPVQFFQRSPSIRGRHRARYPRMVM